MPELIFIVSEIVIEEIEGFSFERIEPHAAFSSWEAAEDYTKLHCDNLWSIRSVLSFIGAGQ